MPEQLTKQNLPSSFCRMTRRELLKYSVWSTLGLAATRADHFFIPSASIPMVVQDIQRIDTCIAGLNLTSHVSPLLLETAWLGWNGVFDSNLFQSVSNPRLSLVSRNLPHSVNNRNIIKAPDGITEVGEAWALCPVESSHFALRPSTHVLRLLRAQVPFLCSDDIRSTLLVEQTFLPSQESVFQSRGAHLEITKTVRMQLRLRVAHLAANSGCGLMESYLTNAGAADLVQASLPAGIKQDQPYTCLCRGQLGYQLHSLDSSLDLSAALPQTTTFQAGTGELQPTLRLWSSVPELSHKLFGTGQTRRVEWGREESGSMQVVQAHC